VGRQGGAVREKLAGLVCYREGINAHLTAAIATAEPSLAGLLMPNQSLLFTGRVHACTGDAAVEKFYSVNEAWSADDRRRLLAFARDLVNSDYAGHRLTFELFAQSPPYAHLNAVYMNFDFDTPLRFVKQAAGLSDRVM
jgi:4-hydroxyphenylacetate 3-monooxygenase